MLNFLLKREDKKKKDININDVYAGLKAIFNFSEITDERKESLTQLMQTHGYLPYPHIKALEELSEAETLFCLETKWENEGVFKDDKFIPSTTSVLARNNIKDSNWIKKEGHEIKLINLAALGDGNKSDDAGKFVDWLKQLLILPTGNKERGIFSTTIYLTPFYEREFGCAYLPSSTEVSSKIEDKQIKDALDLSVKAQVQVFITLAQLAGHPVIYDVLPQTGRFSKTILANPHVARWFDLKEFHRKIENCIELVAKELERKHDKEDVEIVKNIYKSSKMGELSQNYKLIYDKFDNELLKLKKTNSKEMLKRENQVKIQKKVKEIIAKILELKPNQTLSEDNITKQMEITKTLMEEGLWTAPGEAWCSAGVPVFDKMSECGSYPIFKHFDFKDQDISEYANLDCQTPFYFTFLENGQYNKPIVDFYVDYVKNIQNEYNFDGIRIDHADHIVDEVSIKNGAPISYRITAFALNQLNSALKAKVPHFATIAEYMGYEYLKEYHKDMLFDVLWGNDIPAQHEKTPEKIMDDNQFLSNYNTTDFKTDNLSILKTYNNQDGEFSVIDQYPALLGKEGAIFKWFKYKMLPGGKQAQRPIMYVDGDESFTKTGIERTIGQEVSMKREKDYEFFAKFDAISRFAKSQELITEGEAQIIIEDEDGFTCWLISKETLKTAILVVANYLPPTERSFAESESGGKIEIIKNEAVLERKINLPGDYKLKSEFIFDGKNFDETEINEDKDSLEFEKLEPSEFKIYLLSK